MEGCEDGTWRGTRYFRCAPGRGFISIYSTLKPDNRRREVTFHAYEKVSGQPGTALKKCSYLLNFFLAPYVVLSPCGNKRWFGGLGARLCPLLWIDFSLDI